jgi:uncharacterized membrane protein YdbT with pleckstrin-like domain/ribosomal protein L40E
VRKNDLSYDELKIMYCNKCGANNSEEAVYCQKCGNPLESEEETRVLQKTKPSKFTVENDEEAQIFSIRPTLMFVKMGYVAAIIGAFLLVALLAFFSSLLSSPISAVIVVIVGLSLLLIPAYFHLKNKLVKYTLTDSKIEVDKGLVSHTTRNVPLRTIQDVTVSATVTQRMLGFGNIVIENANEEDDKIILHNINSPKKYADILLKQMRLLDK